MHKAETSQPPRRVKENASGAAAAARLSAAGQE